MKKCFALVAAVLLTISSASAVFAIHAEIPSETQAVIAKSATEVTIGGDVRFRGTFASFCNEPIMSDLNNPIIESPGRCALYESRVRLQIEAQVTPSTIGRIHMEAGTDNTSDNMAWGASGNGAFGNISQGDAKMNTIRILEAWIQHRSAGLLGVPAYIKVGHMPINISNGLFYQHVRFGDDALLFGVEPVKGLEITLGNVKMAEGTNGHADDVDAYTLIAAYQINKDSKIGIDVTYVDGQNLAAGTSIGGINSALGTFAFPLNGSDLHLWNFGVNGMTRIAGLGLKFEVNAQRGKGTVDGASPLADLKFRGWATTLDADYKVNPVTLKAGFGYGSGTGIDESPAFGGKVKTFVTTQSVIPHYTFVYDYFVANAAGNVAGGLQNTWYLRLGGAVDISKDLYADLTAYYLRAVKTGPGLFDGSRISKNVGAEVDATIKYRIDRNLTYYVEVGYLFAGNFFQGGNPNRNIDDAWVVRHGVQFSF